MRRDQQILAVASRLFSERGFTAVSVDEIGEAAGVSGPALYRHFSGKSDILEKICDLTLERLDELVGEAPAAPAGELEALVRGQARLSLRHPELACAHEIERALADDKRRRFRRRQRDHARRWIAAIRALQPARSEDDIALTVYAAIGMMISAARWPRELRQRDDVEAQLVARAYAVLGIAAPKRVAVSAGSSISRRRAAP